MVFSARSEHAEMFSFVRVDAMSEAAQKVTPSERPRPKHRYCPDAHVETQLALEKLATLGERMGLARSVQRQPVNALSPELLPPLVFAHEATKGSSSMESELTTALEALYVASSRYAKAL